MAEKTHKDRNYIALVLSSLYTTKSRPFDPPTTGKIAVKVINHYGDEVLKVYEVGIGLT